jgi:hypothetical protein
VPRRKASLILLALALVGAPAAAQDDRSELEVSLGRPRRVPPVPADLRPLFRQVTRDRLVIRDLRGADIVLDIRQYEPDEFRQFAGGRFIGFSFTGYESFGYLLIDRAMTGEEAVIATGDRPVFSPDGRYFAAVQSSGGAETGNLEGFALWQVTADGSRQRLFNTALPPGEDWRVDGWGREDCVGLSAAPPGTRDATPPPARIGLSVMVDGERIALDGESRPPCGAADSPRPDG